MMHYNSIGTITEENYDEIFNCNVKSHVFLTQLVIPYLIKTKGVLSIINVNVFKKIIYLYKCSVT